MWKESQRGFEARLPGELPYSDSKQDVIRQKHPQGTEAILKYLATPTEARL